MNKRRCLDTAEVQRVDVEQNRDNSRTQLNWEWRETNQQGLRDYNKTDAKRKGFPDPVKLKRVNGNREQTLITKQQCLQRTNAYVFLD